MPRKAEPSFELKKIIWDVAATVGKDKSTDIQRQLDYELEKRRKEGNFFECTPDVRTINRIIEKDLNELDPKVVRSKLPPHVWKLRNDYDTIKKESLLTEQAEQARRHDKRIFRESNAILSEEKLHDFLWPLDGGPPIYYYKKADSVDEFLRFFSYEGNQYIDHEAKRLCDNLCDALGKLTAFLSEEFRPHARSGVCDWARLIPKDIAHAYYSGEQDPEDSEVYWECFNELQNLKGTCEDYFKQYRVYFRDNLII